MATSPNYGIDAPHAIRNLCIGGVACVAVAFALPRLTIGPVTFVLNPGLFYSAAWLFAPAILMLIYAKAGKFRNRERTLAKVGWTGAETVLDVGAGRGLLSIGAGRRLTTGHTVGIDIWNAEDLSGNSPQALLGNIAVEGVEVKAEIKSEDARKMRFPDGTFDVVLSHLCLHNIYQREGRALACREICRMLKPGGVAVISDFTHLREFATAFAACGLTVEFCPLDWAGTFPPLRILVAKKAA